MKKSLIALMILLATSDAWAQSRKISGKVLDQSGQPIPGAGVVVKGTSIGTMTDANGVFQIDLPEKSKSLVIQSIGFSTTEVNPGDEEITVKLNQDTKQLQGAVVTALGISKQRKQIGYTVNSVSSDDIRRSGEQNVIQSLAAKAPGVQVIQSSGTPGASSRIVLRGNNSFGDNQPLVVVDGIPVDNSTSQPVAGDYPYNQNLTGVNESNRALDINPNDIESVSILKGPAAAALYGQRGGNGAIIITTKRGKFGKNQGLGITFTSSVDFSMVNKMPELQTKYAQGTKGNYNTYDPGDDGLVDTDDDNPGTSSSWGPRIDTVAGLKSYDNVKAFFKTGVTYNNDLSITGGNENTVFRMSVSNSKTTGVVPNSKFERTTVRLTAENKATDWLTVGGTVNYTHSEGQRVQNGSNLSGIMLSLTRTPASFDITKYYDAGRQQQIKYFSLYDNPLFTANFNPYNDYTNRVMGNIYTRANINKHLSFSWKVGTDAYNTNARQVFAVTSLGDDVNSGKGQLNFSNSNYMQVYTDAILKYENNLSDKFDITAFVGFNHWYEESNFQFSRGRNMLIPGVNNLTNTSELYSSNSASYQKTQAIYGEVAVGYMNQVYLTLTGRAEKSSTFGKDAPAYTYPKADLSWIFSETLPKNEMLTYGKLRTAIAVSAVSADPYSDRNYYVIPFITDGYTNGNSFPYLGQGAFGVSNTLFPGNLKPQYSNATEIGVETRWFHNRVNFEAVYYNQTNTNLLLSRPVAPSTGYTYSYSNSGTIVNKGVEITLGGDVIKSTDFNWNITANWSKNVSEVTKLAPGVDQATVESGFSDIGSFNIVGQPYGVFYGTAWQRDSKGRILVDDNGQALVQQAAVRIGNPNPDWLMNINNVLTYKKWTLSFLWDIRHGGDIWNGTYARLNRLGRTEESADRARTFVIDGVYAPGTANEGQQNTTAVSSTYYWQTFRGDAGNYAAENAIQDGSWVRLRQLGLSYRHDFPANNIAKIKYLEFGISGRNLLLFTKYKGVDPETSLTGAGSNLLGYDYFNNPGTKSILLNVRMGL